MLVSISSVFAVNDNATDLNSQITDEVVQLSEDTVISEDIVSDDVNDTVAKPTVIMGDVTKRYNGAIQYKATFYDNNGSALKNKQVLFAVDGKEFYNITTDSKGIALLNILITNGKHNITALNLDTLDTNSSNIKVFSVITKNKDINMYYDDGTTYKVRVFDNNGNALKAGKKVTFTVGDKKYTQKTDKNGYAKLKITAKPGIYAITAQYKDYVVANLLYVKQVLNPITTFSGKALKSTFKYKVKFLGKNNKNKKITVKFNKKTYKAKTNKKGIATFTLKTPKKVGYYNVVTSYKNTKVTSVFGKYYA